MKLILTFSIILFGFQSLYSQFDDVDKIYNAKQKKKEEFEFSKLILVGDKIIDVSGWSRMKLNIYNKDLSFSEKKVISLIFDENQAYTQLYLPLSNEEKWVSLCYGVESKDYVVVVFNERFENKVVYFPKLNKKLNTLHSAFVLNDDFYYVFYDSAIDSKSPTNTKFHLVKIDHETDGVSLIDIDLEGKSETDLWAFSGHDDEGYYFSNVDLLNSGKQLLITILKFDSTGKEVDEKELELENEHSIFGTAKVESKFLDFNLDYSYMTKEYKGDVTYLIYRPGSYGYLYFDNDYKDFVLTTNSVGVNGTEKEFKKNHNEKGIKITLFDENLEKKISLEIPPFISSDYAGTSGRSYLHPKKYELDRRGESSFVVKTDGWIGQSLDFSIENVYYFLDKDGVEVFGNEDEVIYYMDNMELKEYKIKKDSYKDFEIKYINGQIILINRHKESIDYSRFKKFW